MKRHIPDSTKQKAKSLRKALTPAEKKLWHYLREKESFGFHVRRQHPIGPYIADFCIEKIQTIIEVDGYTHDFRMDKDEIRDRYLNDLGYRVIRIPSKDVMNNVEGVVEYIKNICENE